MRQDQIKPLHLPSYGLKGHLLGGTKREAPVHMRSRKQIGKNGVAGNRTQNLLHSVMLKEQC
jgi:hypothetical protein